MERLRSAPVLGRYGMLPAMEGVLYPEVVELLIWTWNLKWIWNICNTLYITPFLGYKSKSPSAPMLFTIQYLDVSIWYTIDHSPVFNSLLVLLPGSSFPRIYDKSIHIIHQSSVLHESRSPFFRGSSEGTESLQSNKVILPEESYQ